jgi:hypothetical protein
MAWLRHLSVLKEGKMLCMKNPVALFVLGVLLAGTTAQSRDSGGDSSKELIGRWDALIRLGDGKGQTLQFSGDGSVAESWDYERRGSYHLKGSRLSISTWSEKEKRQRERLFETVPNGKQLTLREAQGEEITLTQVCKGDEVGAGVVREWYSDNFPGVIPVVTLTVPLQAPVFVEFTKDGNVYFRSAPIKSAKSSYEFQGKKLILKRDGAAPLELRPRISSKRLDIRILGDGTPELPFRRIESSECGLF